MSWLDEPYDIEYLYECPDKHRSIYVAKNTEQDEMRKPRACLEEGCGHEAQYAGSAPRKIGIVGRVTYEQNGVKGVRITDGKGGVQHVSLRKLNYLESGGESTKAFYTKEKTQALVAQGRTDLLEDRNPKKERQEAQRAKVEKAKATASQPITSKDGGATA